MVLDLKDRAIAQQIHDATVRILGKVGMEFQHPDAIEVLKEHGVRVEGNVAYFTEEEIMEWIGKAPKQTPVYAPDPKHNAIMGDGKTYLGPAGYPVSIIEADGTKRPSVFADFVKVMKLYEGNPRYDVTGGAMAHAGDIPTEWSFPLFQYASQQMSRKSSFAAAASSYEEAEALIGITAAAHGITKEEMKDHPLTFTIPNVSSPLHLDKGPTELMLTFAKYHQPVGLSAADMAGTTSPVTIAGTIVQTNAEVIGSLVMMEMFEPGAPAIYGSTSASADMRSLQIAIGSPEAALCYRWGSIMGHFYGLPTRAGGALCDAKSLDAQAGFESMLAYMATAQNHTDIAYQGTGILEGFLSLSFEKVISDFDIINYVDTYLADIEINEDTVPEIDFEEVGHNGNWVTIDHTLDNYDVLYSPYASVRGPAQADKFMTNCQERVQGLVDSYKIPGLDEDRVSNMRDVLREYGVSEEMIEKVDTEIHE